MSRLAEQFNLTRAGERTPLDQPIPKITLPADYHFGDTYITQDLRVSRSFTFHERYKLVLIGEAFNLFNIANLSGYSGTWQTPRRSDSQHAVSTKSSAPAARELSNWRHGSVSNPSRRSARVALVTRGRKQKPASTDEKLYGDLLRVSQLLRRVSNGDKEPLTSLR